MSAGTCFDPASPQVDNHSVRSLVLCLLAVLQLVLPAPSPAPAALPCAPLMESCCEDDECPCSAQACTCRPADQGSTREPEKPGAVCWHSAGLELALIHGSGAFEFVPQAPPQVLEGRWAPPVVHVGRVQAWLQVWRT